MAIDVSYRDTFTTSAEDLSRTNKNFIVNQGVSFDGLKVTQSGTPAMTVAVSAGTGYFYGSGSNSNVMYEFYSDASETVTIGASGVQARIDIICLKVDASTQVASIVAVAGTPSGSPVVPATPASHYKLAEVAVGAGVTTITNANITDTRRSAYVLPTASRISGLLGGKIVPSVASNNLTVAIKTLDDADPSITSPVGIWVGDRLRWITSALSVTANAGTNWFNSGSAELATREVDYFAYIGFNATDGVTLGFSRIPYVNRYDGFSATSTNEKFARISTITNATASDTYVNVGRFVAILSAGAGYTWTVPTFTTNNLIQKPIFMDIGLIIYPVGAIFIHTVNINPSTWLGGTWVAFGIGRTLIGVDTGQTEFDTIEKTGGAKTHTLTTGEMPSHTHIQDSHNHTQNSHNHTQDAHTHRTDIAQPFSTNQTRFTINAGGGGAAINGADGLQSGSTTATNQATTATNQATTATNQNTGGGGAHNNLQPYITVYFFKRTA